MRHSIPAARAPRRARRHLLSICVLVLMAGSLDGGHCHANTGQTRDPFEGPAPAAVRDPFDEPGRPSQARSAGQASVVNPIAVKAPTPARRRPVAAPKATSTSAAQLSLASKTGVTTTGAGQQLVAALPAGPKQTAPAPSVKQQSAAMAKRLIDYRIRPVGHTQAEAPNRSTVLDPFHSAEEAARIADQLGSRLRQANFQVAPDIGDEAPELPAPIARPAPQQPAATLADPCAAAAAEKKLFELDIDIGLPEGQLPTDFAAACWETTNQPGSPFTALRCWPASTYMWDATCLSHRPLYFEEINLERYGYGCAGCLQPAASAAHFFGTVPALPYLIAADRPHECIYTLGHYRPGSCPPWRQHWPPCDPLAATAQGGVITGLIFLIP